jgi:hypothetical protein
VGFLFILPVIYAQALESGWQSARLRNLAHSRLTESTAPTQTASNPNWPDTEQEAIELPAEEESIPQTINSVETVVMDDPITTTPAESIVVPPIVEKPTPESSSEPQPSPPKETELSSQKSATENRAAVINIPSIVITIPNIESTEKLETPLPEPPALPPTYLAKNLQPSMRFSPESIAFDRRRLIPSVDASDYTPPPPVKRVELPTEPEIEMPVKTPPTEVLHVVSAKPKIAPRKEEISLARDYTGNIEIMNPDDYLKYFQSEKRKPEVEISLPFQSPFNTNNDSLFPSSATYEQTRH